jgi:hypothetical protein
MKVKIGNRIIDSNEQPVMIILSNDEKEMIGNMAGQDLKFCCFPEDSSVEEIEQFMIYEDPNQLTMAIDNNVVIVNSIRVGD